MDNKTQCCIIQARMTLVFLGYIFDLLDRELSGVEGCSKESINKMKSAYIEDFRQSFILYDSEQRRFGLFSDICYYEGNNFKLVDYFELNSYNLKNNRISHLGSLTIEIQPSRIPLGLVCSILKQYMPGIYGYKSFFESVNNLEYKYLFHIMLGYTLIYLSFAVSETYNFINAFKYNQPTKIESCDKIALSLLLKTILADCGKLIDDNADYLIACNIIVDSRTDDLGYQSMTPIIKNLAFMVPN